MQIEILTMLPTKKSTTNSGQTEIHNANMGIANYFSGKAAIYIWRVCKTCGCSKRIFICVFPFYGWRLEQNICQSNLFCLEMTENPELMNEKFWSKYKKVAKQTFNRRRTLITTGLKNLFLVCTNTDLYFDHLYFNRYWI